MCNDAPAIKTAGALVQMRRCGYLHKCSEIIYPVGVVFLCGACYLAHSLLPIHQLLKLIHKKPHMIPVGQGMMYMYADRHAALPVGFGHFAE